MYMFISKWFIFPKKLRETNNVSVLALSFSIVTRISDSELDELSSRFIHDNYFHLSRCVALKSLEENCMKEKI